MSPLKSLPVPWKEGCVGGAKISRLKIFLYTAVHRKIRLIESNAKSCHLKKLTCKGTLGQVFICRRPRTPYPPPPPYTLYTCIQYTYSYMEGGKGRELYHREGEMGNSSQSCVKNTNMTSQSLNSDKHLPQSPLKGNFFRWRHFALLSV